MSNTTPVNVDATMLASVTPALIERLAALVAADADTEQVTTTAPYTGTALANLPISTPGAVEAAFSRARVAQVATPVRERARILPRFHALVLERQGEALGLMQVESGKTRRPLTTTCPTKEPR